MKNMRPDISSLRSSFARGLADALEYVRTDVRDVWPSEIEPTNYTEGDTLSSGQFGRVITARARSVGGGLAHLEPRTCVIKCVDVASRFSSCVTGEKDSMLSRIERLQRRVIMEAYVLNRMRHSNIMHAHATVFDATSLSLHLVLPRMYPLGFFIEKYRQDKDSEPMHIRLIMMIVRQVCRGLEYLHSANIVHSDVQPNNIYMTRGGTLKLGHFSQCRLLTADCQKKCITPTGSEEFMCYEKQYNLHVAQSFDQCLPYNTAADIWSVGVLVIHLVSYFPNEKWHRLPKNFALQMGELKMPFKWMANELMQLRVRLCRTGDENLKKFLGDKLLNIFPEVRATATEVLQSDILKKWCYEDLEKDKEYLVSTLVHRYDWPNRLGLEVDGPNYDACETKDVPVEFYWDNTWKKLEKRLFGFNLQVSDGQCKRPGGNIERQFRHADTSLFEALLCGADDEELDIVDIVPIDQSIRNLCFALMNKLKARPGIARLACFEDTILKLPPTLACADRTARLRVSIVS